MPRFVSVLLWVMVAIAGVAIVWLRSIDQSPAPQPLDQPSDSEVVTTKDGRAFVRIPWDHLPSVDRFELTDQSGKPLDTAALHGRPYVVSFFFASCPSFCRDLNNELDRVNQLLPKTDIQFLTITVDPDVDTIKVLKQYADGYDAQPNRWAFLRGSDQQLKRIGRRIFDVVVDRDTHTDNIILVDKWGRYRDRFKWDQTEDMKRFLKVAREVAAETEPPLGKTIETRNVNAGIDLDLAQRPWLRDFHLSGPGGESFFSRDLTGKPWLARFGSMDSETAKRIQDCQQNIRSKTNQSVPWISLGEGKTSPQEPNVADLQSYEVEGVKLRRIAREYFGANVSAEDDTNWVATLRSTVFVVDRWGNVRDAVSLDDEDSQDRLAEQIRVLSAEKLPPAPTFGFSKDDLKED